MKQERPEKESFEAFEQRLNEGAKKAGKEGLINNPFGIKKGARQDGDTSAMWRELERPPGEIPAGTEAARPKENRIAVIERLRKEKYAYIDTFGSPSELARYQGHGNERFRIVCLGDEMHREYLLFEKKRGLFS